MCSFQFVSSRSDQIKKFADVMHVRPRNMKPKEFVPGLRDALMMMSEGDIWEVYLGSKLAYGASGGFKVPPNSAVSFKIELYKILGDKV